MEQSEQKQKILILGNSSVGKSCLLLRYTEKQFQSSHIATVGIDFKIQHLEFEGTKIVMQIWDTAGQERFRTVTSTLYKSSSGVALIYSVLDKKSFDDIIHWVIQIKDNSPKDIPIILIANKTDLANPEIQEEQGFELAKQLKIPFFQVSALTGQNVQKAFDSLAQLAFQFIKNDPKCNENNTLVKISDEQTNKKRCC